MVSVDYLPIFRSTKLQIYSIQKTMIHHTTCPLFSGKLSKVPSLNEPDLLLPNIVGEQYETRGEILVAIGSSQLTPDYTQGREKGYIYGFLKQYWDLIAQHIPTSIITPADKALVAETVNGLSEKELFTHVEKRYTEDLLQTIRLTMDYDPEFFYQMLGHNSLRSSSHRQGMNSHQTALEIMVRWMETMVSHFHTSYTDLWKTEFQPYSGQGTVVWVQYGHLKSMFNKIYNYSQWGKSPADASQVIQAIDEVLTPEMLCDTYEATERVVDAFFNNHFRRSTKPNSHIGPNWKLRTDFVEAFQHFTNSFLEKLDPQKHHWLILELGSGDRMDQPIYWCPMLPHLKQSRSVLENYTLDL